MRKGAGGFKDKIVNFLKANTPKQTVYGRGKKLSNPKNEAIKSLVYKKRKRIKDRLSIE